MSTHPELDALARQMPSLGLPLSQQPALQMIYDTAPIGLAFLSPEGRYLHINQRLTEICGISIEGHLGRTVRECVPGLADSVEAIIRLILQTGEPVTGIEVAGQRGDQNDERSWITHWHPFRDSGGKIVGINVAAEEITERKRAEAALQASERQFHTLADSIPQLVWMADADGGIFWFNNHWYDYAGKPASDLLGSDWTEILDPADEGRGAAEWEQSLRAGSAFEMELPLRGKDGEYRPFLTRVVPLRDSSHAIYHWIGTHIDISEQKRREEHIRFVVDELSHRTKNLLAVVMAVAHQTARHTCDVTQYQARFAERLTALAHCHDLLVRDNWHGASFCDLIAAQLKPFQTSEGQIETSGPPIILKPDAVQNLGLAFHELATNASKHGALSSQDGKVSIQWLLNERAKRIHVLWSESGGPAVLPPQRKGFGHVVIEQIVPRALGGIGRLNFAPAGVTWTFEFPVQV